MKDNSDKTNNKPDCDFIDYCGDKAIGQMMIGSKVHNVCLYHANETWDDTDPEDREIVDDGSLEYWANNQ